MATPITGPSRVSTALAAPLENTPAPTTLNTAAAHSKATRHNGAQVGTPATGVPRDSLAAHTPHTSPNPFTASTYLQTAKQLLDQLGLSGPAAQTFFDKQVARILAEDPARLESWLAGWILAAHHNASSASTPREARDSSKPESGLALLAQQPYSTDEQRVELATLVALPDAELRHRLSGDTGSPARPAA